MGFLTAKRLFYLLAISIVFLSTATADEVPLSRLQKLIDDNDGAGILAEKESFSKVINMNIWPVNDCSTTPVLYAIQKHSNDALKALLEVPGVKPTTNYAQADIVNGKYPQMYLLHVATLVTSTLREKHTAEKVFAERAMCDTAVFKPDQETWDIIKTIPDLDVNQFSFSKPNYAHKPRYANCTALHIAALTENCDLAVSNLLSFENIDFRSQQCRTEHEFAHTPFDLAVSLGNHRLIRKLLTTLPTLVEVLDPMNDSVLLGAVMKGDLETVEAILSFESALTIVNLAADTGFNALHIASQESLNQPKRPEFIEITRLLVKAMSPEAVNARTLKRSRHNTDITRQFTPGKTALHIAVIGNRTETVRSLLVDGIDKVDPNAIDTDSSFTPLHMAGYYNLPEIVQLLLNHPKIEVNSLTKAAKRTPLHTTVKASSTEAAGVLLMDDRVDLEALDGSGYKPEDWAKGWYWGNARVNEMFKARRMRDMERSGKGKERVKDEL